MRHGDKALVALVAACALTACSASHETARQVASTDSLQVESRWRLATTTVPESQVELAIPVETLRSLPATGLADHQGQATARVRLRHDTLYVAATCDSLRRLVLEYEGQLRHTAALRERRNRVCQDSHTASNILMSDVIPAKNTDTKNKMAKI